MAETVRLFREPVELDPITPAGVSVLNIAHNIKFGFGRTWPHGMGATTKVRPPRSRTTGHP